MTLTEIRKKYGVPAEVGMRVRCNNTHDGVILKPSKFDPRCLVVRWINLDYQGLVPIAHLTYYNDDGEVIWRPE